MIATIAFYLFATLTIASSVAVIFARNPVHSVLWLIVAVFAHKAGPMLAGHRIPAARVPNIVGVGQMLYSRYLFAFELAGLILLVAMVGAIVLTHRRRGDTRTPKAWRQLRRHPDSAIDLVQPGIGEGMKL